MGDYNLLPHQEALLRKIVKAYDEKKCRQTFFALSTVAGGEILEEDCSVTFTTIEQETLWDDLKQLANERLLAIVDNNSNSIRYQITAKTLGVVREDFRSPTATITTPQITSSHLDFSFVASSDLRAIVEHDFEEVQKCLSLGAYKAAVVICGSIVEALLLQRLIKEEARALLYAKTFSKRWQNKPLDKWELYQLIDIANGLKILDDDAKIHADQLRGYRNVIHPGVQQRTKFQVTPGKATSALALLQLVVEKLSLP